MDAERLSCKCSLCGALITQQEADESAAIRHDSDTLCVKCAESLNATDAE